MSGRLEHLDESAIAALQFYIQQRTVPLLLRQDDGEYELLGTGTLAELLGRKFIVTARHSVVGRPLEKLHLPEAPAEVSTLKPLRHQRLHAQHRRHRHRSRRCLSHLARRSAERRLAVHHRRRRRQLHCERYLPDRGLSKGAHDPRRRRYIRAPCDDHHEHDRRDPAGC